MAHISSISIVNTTGIDCPVGFDNSYKGDAVTQRVLEITGFGGITGWSVLETVKDEEEVPELALIHYNDDGTDAYGHVRGDVIDLEVGTVIAKSFGHTPTAVVERLVDADGALNIKDTEGRMHVFDAATCSIKRGVECVVFRAIKRKGKMHLFTHKRLTPDRSRWGSSPYFVSMYQEAGGPTEEQLFDPSKPFSSTCYVFAVVHPALLVATRQVVNAPYLVHLASFTMDLKRPDDQVAPGIATFPTSSVIGGTVDASFIYSPPDLSVEEANAHLKHGYYDVDPNPSLDPRQETGEMLIIYSADPATGDIVDIVKVHSPSYEWRITMRGNNPNIMNQFYSMLNLVYNDIRTQKEWDDFCAKFIVLPLYDEQALKDLFEQHQSILLIPSGPVSHEDMEHRDARIHLLWMNFVLSLPPTLQREALNILTRFKNERAAVIDWLQNLEAQFREIEKLSVEAIMPDFAERKINDQQRRKYEACFRRVTNIISAARKLARGRVADRTNYSVKGSHMRLPLVIKSTIRNFIHKEDGPSLYNLVRLMKDSQAPPKTTIDIPIAATSGQ